MNANIRVAGVLLAASVLGACGGGGADDRAPGDMCEAPPRVSSHVGTATFVGSTSREPSQLSGPCGGESGREAVLGWKAPATGAFVIDTDGSDFDTVLYAVPCSASFLECDDDAGAGLSSEITVWVEKNDRVYIVVDGYDELEHGEFVVNIYPL